MREISDAVEASHANLSRLALELLHLSHRDRRLAERLRVESTILEEFIRLYAYPVHSIPTLLDAEAQRRIEGATIGVMDLLKKIPERVFDNDPSRIASFYGIESDFLAGLLLEPPNGLAGSLARCDFMESERGFYCVEANSTAYLGGWQVRFFAEALLESDEFRAFLEEHEVTLEWIDPLAAVFEHVIAEATELGLASDGELNLAFCVNPETPEEAQPASYFSRVYARVLEASSTGLGGQVFFRPYPHGIEARDNRLWIGDRRVHALLEYTEWPTPQSVYRCFKAGYAALYNGPVAHLLGDKRNLDLLSRHRDRFDAEDRELIDRHVPWSREVADGVTEYRGERCDLVELLLSRREKMVIKPSGGARGEGVHVGRFTSPERWERVVRRGAARGPSLLAQEYIRSRPYGFHGTDGELTVYDLAWGLFAFGRRFGGGFLRMQPRDSGDGVINSHRGAEEGFFFQI